MQQMKQSLSDAEVVALDAKKESSFLRSENLALKEKLVYFNILLLSTSRVYVQLLQDTVVKCSGVKQGDQQALEV